jgi:hypothetical protein
VGRAAVVLPLPRCTSAGARIEHRAQNQSTAPERFTFVRVFPQNRRRANRSVCDTSRRVHIVDPLAGDAKLARHSECDEAATAMPAQQIRPSRANRFEQTDTLGGDRFNCRRDRAAVHAVRADDEQRLLRPQLLRKSETIVSAAGETAAVEEERKSRSGDALQSVPNSRWRDANIRRRFLGLGISNQSCSICTMRDETRNHRRLPGRLSRRPANIFCRPNGMVASTKVPRP